MDNSIDTGIKPDPNNLLPMKVDFSVIAFIVFLFIAVLILYIILYK